MVTRALCRPIYRLPSSIDGTCAARRHEKLTRFSGAEYPGDEPGRSEVRDVQEQTRTLQGESETNRGGVRRRDVLVPRTRASGLRRYPRRLRGRGAACLARQQGG